MPVSPTYANRISQIPSKLNLLLPLILASQKFKLETRILEVVDDPKDDESGLDGLRERDHGQFSVISRFPRRQVEVGKVDDKVFTLVLFVEEADFRGTPNDVVGNDALDEDGFDAVDFSKVDSDIREGLLEPTPPRGRVEPDILSFVIGPAQKENIVCYT